MSEKLTRTEDWTQWKDRCAYDLCDEDVRSRLGPFGIYRLKRYLDMLDPALAANLEPASSDDDRDSRGFADVAWHLFDSRIITKGTIKDKACKDWLLQDVASLSSIEGRASLLFRESAREHDREASGGRSDDSLERTIRGTDGLTLGDLLKGEEFSPAEKLDFSELSEEIQNLGEAFFEKLSLSGKVAVLAKALSVSLDDPEVTRLAGKKKATLYENLKVNAEAFAESLRKVVGLESVEKDFLILRSFDILGEFAKIWGKKPENGCASLFKDGDD